MSVATQERDRIQGLHDELNKAQTDLADSEKTVHTAEKSLAEAIAEEDTARVHLEAARTQLNELGERRRRAEENHTEARDRKESAGEQEADELSSKP